MLGARSTAIFAADSLAQARDRLSEAVAHLDGRLAKIATLLEDAETRGPGILRVPSSHWRKLRSTNPDVLLLGAFGQDSANIINQVREIGWDVPLANTSWVAIPAVLENPAAEGLPEVFASRRAASEQEAEALQARLYQEIGQLKVELDWLKRKTGLAS